MPATDDRWDVVVVGLRDPSHANRVIVVAELAHYASIPADEINRQLDNDAELEVLINLDRAEAERSAQELSELGAVVDLRLTPSKSGVFPVFKPDAERQVGVAVGGLIDDSATPPTVGESHGALPEVEPDPESVPLPPRRRRPTGRGAGLSISLGTGAGRDAPISERPVLTRGPPPDPLEMLPMGDSGVRNALDDLGGPPRIGEDLSAQASPARPAQRDPPRAQPDRSAGAAPGAYEIHREVAGPRGAPGAPPKARPPAGSRARAPRADKAKARARSRPSPQPKPQPRPKPSPVSVAPTLNDTGPAATPARPKLPSRLEKSAVAGSSPGSAIELDFEAVGLSKPPRGGIPTARPLEPLAPPKPLDAQPRRTRAGNTGGTGESASGRPSDPTALEVLRDDRVAMTLLAVAIALMISLMVALQVQRGDVRDLLPPLEEELAASLNDPAAVETGELRSPSTVEDQINDTLDGMEGSFLLWWLAIGIPVGLAISRMRTS